MNDKLSNIKVVKFGGSSLADANQFKKVASIILSDPSRVFVVASAPGKRDDTDEKVTDMLLLKKQQQFGMLRDALTSIQESVLCLRAIMFRQNIKMFLEKHYWN